jgi:hypothetical protein
MNAVKFSEGEFVNNLRLLRHAKMVIPRFAIDFLLEFHFETIEVSLEGEVKCVYDCLGEI